MIVVITGASSGIGGALKQHFQGRGDHVIPIDRTHGFDLRTYDGIQKAVQHIEWSKQPIDVLINNAGIMLPFESELGFESACNMVHLNLMAVWYLMRKIPIPQGGNIINISSIAGINHDEDTALYSATKAGVISLTKAYAKLYAPKGICVNCISPGLFDTNLVPEETPDWLIDKVPLKYEEQPEKLCPVIDMILATKYMTGANIVVDGGLSL
jgi:NAD(P)-dependent dehydrogenase (short-subunit alcohol dehydrogenase family)